MLKFIWDEKKALVNLKKHGLSFVEPVTVFDDSLYRIVYDEGHSIDEHRFITSGVMPNTQRYIIVCHKIESDELYRIISAREMTSAERKVHEHQRREG
ncbi:MAG: BrnT family toxin [Pyrinomonadaceae bacterium]